MSQKGLYGNYLTAPGLLAGASLAAAQFYGVKLASTAGEVVVCNGTNKAPIGIVQNDPADGEAAIVAIGGVARGVSGGTITVGQFVNCLSTGTLQGTAGGSSGTEWVLGVALEAASSGDQFSVLVRPQKLFPT